LFDIDSDLSIGSVIPDGFDMILVLIVAGMALLVLHFLRPHWLGFKGKTLWDWMSLLLVPSIIATATLVVNHVQAQSNQSTIQESAFQQYIDRISNLVLSPLDHNATVTNAVAQAHTAAILQIVRQERAGRVLSFLDQLGRLKDFIPDLEGIDLTNAELKGFNLDGLEFDRVRFVRADLEGASLIRSDLEAVNFSGADLKFTTMHFASFENTIMDKANLAHADIRFTDLSKALGLTSTQLALACFDETTILPQYVGKITPIANNCQIKND
jgi:hypothetical protein